MGKLRQEDLVTIRNLKSKGQSNRAIARLLSVNEKTVRHHLERGEAAVDGRSLKASDADGYADVIEAYMTEQQALAPTRAVNVKLLYEHLVANCDCRASYRSVLRYVRRHYPAPRRRPSRRVETPPGAQAQVDWFELSGVDIGNGPQRLYAFVMTLSHSRACALIWRESMRQADWQAAHNAAFRRFDGLPAILRIDNLKTGVASGAGHTAVLNASYAAYARSLGLHIDPCPPRHPEAKGKVESRVAKLRADLALTGRCFGSLAELQAYTDRRLEASAQRRRCPATGRTVAASFAAEQRLLQALPVLPEAFDVAVSRPVYDDCTVAFEGRRYSVPFALAWQRVEVRGCASRVQIWHEGLLQAEHPRHTEALLVLDPAHYEGDATDRVLPPTPLGKLSRRLLELAEAPVQYRAADYYALLAEEAAK